MTSDINPMVPAPWEVVLMVGGFCLVGAILILLVVKLALRRSAPDRTSRQEIPRGQRPGSAADPT